jgi:hypothetical protein
MPRVNRKSRPVHDLAAHPGDRPVEASGRSLMDRIRRGLEVVRHHRHRHRRLYRGGGRGLVVLVGVLTILSIGAYVVGLIGTMRLSGTAQVRIVTSVVTGGSAFDQSPAGTYLHYTYVVNGTTYSGVDFRRWFDVAARDPKVCFDPANPASHVLVEGDFQCGKGTP